MNILTRVAGAFAGVAVEGPLDGRGGPRGTGEDLEAARGRAGRPGCAERAAREDVDEVRGGGAGTTWSGRRGQPGCAKRAARARTRRRAAAEAGAAWSGGGGGSRAAATAGDDLEGRLHGPCIEDAEVRGGAGEEEGGGARGRVCWAI